MSFYAVCMHGFERKNGTEIEIDRTWREMFTYEWIVLQFTHVKPTFTLMWDLPNQRPPSTFLLIYFLT